MDEEEKAVEKSQLDVVTPSKKSNNPSSLFHREPTLSVSPGPTSIDECTTPQELMQFLNKGDKIVKQCFESRDISEEITVLIFDIAYGYDTDNISTTKQRNPFCGKDSGEIHFDSNLFKGIFRYDANFQIMEFTELQNKTYYYHHDKRDLITKFFQKLIHLIFGMKCQLSFSDEELIDMDYVREEYYYSAVGLSKRYIINLGMQLADFEFINHPYDSMYYILKPSVIPAIFTDKNGKVYKCNILIKRSRRSGVCGATSSAKIIGNAIKFDRNCMIFQKNDKIRVWFDKPITILGTGGGDICFKLRIEGVNVTGNRFYFENNYCAADWKFRWNKYNPGYYPKVEEPVYRIQEGYTVHSYNCLEAPYDDINNRDYYGYIYFHKALKKGGFQILKQ